MLNIDMGANEGSWLVLPRGTEVLRVGDHILEAWRIGGGARWSRYDLLDHLYVGSGIEASIEAARSAAEEA